MYNISDIVHTHRLLFTCNYELCILYSIAHYSRTYIFFSLKCEVKSHFLCNTENFRVLDNYEHFVIFFYESVIEAHCQEWRPQ